MNTDDFESRLARTPLAPPPGEWREAILQAARPAPAPIDLRDGDLECSKPEPPRSTWRRWLAVFATPIPTLAGAWALALALYAADLRLERSPSHGVAPAPVSLAAAREHCERILALSTTDEGDPSRGLMDHPTAPQAPVDRPRSAIPVPPPANPAASSERTAWS